MITIIIVNWNAGQHIVDCVNSIVRYHANLVDKIIVIDNDSTDGSEKSIEEIPNVKIIHAGKNLGFAKACNLGAQYAQSEYLLFLNPDAALYADTLPKVVAYMQQPVNAKVGICGVQLIDEEGKVARSCSRFPSAIGFVIHAIGLDSFLFRLGHVMKEWDHAQTQQVDQVIGAFFFVRHSLFKQLDGFDERFFVYYEEVDFSYRAKQAGWNSIYLADVQAFHVGGGTSRQVKAKRLFYSLRSRILYSFKHFSKTGALFVFISTVFIETISRPTLALSRFSWRNLKETCSAYLMFIQWMTSKKNNK